MRDEEMKADHGTNMMSAKYVARVEGGRIHASRMHRACSTGLKRGVRLRNEGVCE